MLRSCGVEETLIVLKIFSTQLAQQWPNNVAVLSALADVRLARQNWIGAQEVAETIRQIGDTQASQRSNSGCGAERAGQIR